MKMVLTLFNQRVAQLKWMMQSAFNLENAHRTHTHIYIFFIFMHGINVNWNSNFFSFNHFMISFLLNILVKSATLIILFARQLLSDIRYGESFHSVILAKLETKRDYYWVVISGHSQRNTVYILNTHHLSIFKHKAGIQCKHFCKRNRKTEQCQWTYSMPCIALR